MKLDRPGIAWVVLCCGLIVGCASPGVGKLAKQSPKPDQDEFSCGEKTPPSLKDVARQ